MELFLAILLGTLFGFVLHRVGASNPGLIIDMLRLRDLHLMKAILLGIGLGSAALFTGLVAGLIDPGHLSVKASEVGVVVGGGILGLGWALAGFCPGTGLVALGDGRRDAVAFVIGGLFGALAYMLAFPAVKAMGLLAPLAGGKVTLAVTGNDSYPALFAGLPGWLVAMLLALAFVALARILPRHPRPRADVHGSPPREHGTRRVKAA